MDWRELTIGQVATMLLDEKYRGLWEKIKKPLREKNFDSDIDAKPMFPMTYALAVVAVWHALSEKKDPGSIDMQYLEDHYYLKDLFWESKKSSDDYFTFPQYFAGGRWNGQYREKAEERLGSIKANHAKEPFPGSMTFAELLDKIGREKKTQSRKAIGVLGELLDEEFQKIQETSLPPKTEALEQRLSRKPGAPDKGAPDLKEKLDHTFAKEVCDLIENGVKQFIFTGAPGTGKTYTATLLARYLGDLQEVGGKLCSYTLVQFHPSYDYTDFVEGLRPIRPIQEGGQIPFVKLDGSFKAFCRRVAEHEEAECKKAEREKREYKKPTGKYFFIIDEINRAELSKVFGELMYCLESDKRGAGHKINTQYQNLRTYDLKKGDELDENDDVFAGGFYIPENVYIIGTMNDIDRSVESMDFALRRRFNFLEAVVDEEMLTSAFSAMGFGNNVKELAERVMALNDVLLKKGEAYGLNRQYFIAHGQFANLPAFIEKTGPLDKILEHVWKYRLETLLREYLRGVNETKVKEFVDSCKEVFWPEDEDG